MNKEILEKDLNEIEGFIYQIYSSVEVCADACAYKEDPCEDILNETKTKLDKLLEKVLEVQSKHIYCNK